MVLGIVCKISIFQLFNIQFKRAAWKTYVKVAFVHLINSEVNLFADLGALEIYYVVVVLVVERFVI